jgi:hypothetical protein
MQVTACRSTASGGRESKSGLAAIRTIARSLAYSCVEVPCGVDADAFYDKGSNMGALGRAVAVI